MEEGDWSGLNKGVNDKKAEGVTVNGYCVDVVFFNFLKQIWCLGLIKRDGDNSSMKKALWSDTP